MAVSRAAGGKWTVISGTETGQRYGTEDSERDRHDSEQMPEDRQNTGARKTRLFGRACSDIYPVPWADQRCVARTAIS